MQLRIPGEHVSASADADLHRVLPASAFPALLFARIYYRASRCVMWCYRCPNISYL